MEKLYQASDFLYLFNLLLHFLWTDQGDLRNNIHYFNRAFIVDEIPEIKVSFVCEEDHLGIAHCGFSRHEFWQLIKIVKVFMWLNWVGCRRSIMKDIKSWQRFLSSECWSDKHGITTYVSRDDVQWTVEQLNVAVDAKKRRKSNWSMRAYGVCPSREWISAATLNHRWPVDHNSQVSTVAL